MDSRLITDFTESIEAIYEAKERAASTSSSSISTEQITEQLSEPIKQKIEANELARLQAELNALREENNNLKDRVDFMSVASYLATDALNKTILRYNRLLVHCVCEDCQWASDKYRYDPGTTSGDFLAPKYSSEGSPCVLKPKLMELCTQAHVCVQNGDTVRGVRSFLLHTGYLPACWFYSALSFYDIPVHLIIGRVIRGVAYGSLVSSAARPDVLWPIVDLIRTMESEITEEEIRCRSISNQKKKPPKHVI